MEMLGLGFLVERVARNALAFEVYLNLFSVELLQLLRLELECWDGVELREMLCAHVPTTSRVHGHRISVGVVALYCCISGSWRLGFARSSLSASARPILTPSSLDQPPADF